MKVVAAIIWEIELWHIKPSDSVITGHQQLKMTETWFRSVRSAISMHQTSFSQPASELKYIHNPVPFAQWGLDLLGPFKQVAGGKKFLVVAIDYFKKWVEAESLATITSIKVEKFIWQNIITRFGLPRVLTVDNGTQFDCVTLRKYLEDFKVAVAYSLVCNPQCNVQAEAANK